MDNPNSFDQELQDAQVANPHTPPDEGTEQTETAETPSPEPEIDYKTKFSESAREAQRLYEEKKAWERQRAEYEARLAETNLQSEPTDALYPGFEELDEDAQRNLIAYTNSVTKRAQEALYQDPAIAFARQSYAEKKWNDAFQATLEKYPDLKETKDDFKAKYFNPQNVPDNIDDVLQDVAKIHLFDRAKELGAREAQALTERVDLEAPTGGDKVPSVSRSLEDWQRLQRQNPAQFAKLAKEYQRDLESGSLKE